MTSATSTSLRSGHSRACGLPSRAGTTRHRMASRTRAVDPRRFAGSARQDSIALMPALCCAGRRVPLRRRRSHWIHGGRWAGSSAEVQLQAQLQTVGAGLSMVLAHRGARVEDPGRAQLAEPAGSTAPACRPRSASKRANTCACSFPAVTTREARCPTRRGDPTRPPSFRARPDAICGPRLAASPRPELVA